MDTTLRFVTAEDLSSALYADAATSATTIVVEDALDFAEKGGQLQINGLEYAYDSCVTNDSDDTGTIHLTTGLTAPAVAGDVVYIVAATGTIATEWEVEVEWAMSDEPITATIPVGLIPFFTAGDEMAGATVSITDDGRKGYVVASRPGEPPVLDGSTVWNPYVIRRLTAATPSDDTWTTPTGWAETQSQGLIVANGSITVDTPGLYVIEFAPAYVTNSAGLRFARISLNGLQVGYDASAAEASSTTFTRATATRVLVQGDVIVAETKQNSGAGLPLSVGAGRSQFSMYRASV